MLQNRLFDLEIEGFVLNENSSIFLKAKRGLHYEKSYRRELHAMEFSFKKIVLLIGCYFLWWFAGESLQAKRAINSCKL
jgi:hypothetical protein